MGGATHDPTGDVHDLGAMTWTEIGCPIVVVPVGSCEQHGPHLPLDTDTVIASALADELAARRSDCVVAPSIAISASGEHRGFPGTLSIGVEIMAGAVIELARSADWAAGIVFVNGHGGNATAMHRARDVFEHERRRVSIWWPSISGGDPHAGHTETSLMLALAPDRVRLGAATAGPIPSLSELVSHGVQPLSPSGVLGDPTTASAEHGRELLDQLTGQLVEHVAAWIDAP
jgi:mycofactocin system creatininase family protein